MRTGAVVRSCGAVVAIAALATSGCVSHMSEGRIRPGVATSPGEVWVAPPESKPAEVPAPSQPPAIPEDLLAQAQHWGLADLLTLALQNSPDTRAAWSAARVAAADLGSRRGAWYPTLYADVSGNAIRGSAAAGRITFKTTSANASVTLNYLLFDFGGRRAAVDEAVQTLIEADWSHNAAIQSVVLQVQQAYYQYLSARAFVEAEEASVTEAQTNLDAAQERHTAGVATIADVLQAKTRLSQARLALQTAQGLVQVVRGGLATAAGIPANTTFDVEMPVEEIPVQEFTAEVERSIALAQERRPDLAAARARVQAATAHYRDVRSDLYPFLSTTIVPGEVWYSGGNSQSTYNAALSLRIPIFNGFTQSYNEIKAREQIGLAEAGVQRLEQSIVLDVWTSYYNVETARLNLDTTADLLDSAKQSYEVASGRYKAGVGSILDLLTASNALELARAQRVKARTDWFVSLAQFAHDTGTLWPAAGGPPAPGDTP